MSGTLVLAAAKSGESVKAGPIGLAVILLLCIACYFLFKSMSTHMRKIREGFPTQQVPPAAMSTLPRVAATPASGATAPSVPTQPSSTRPISLDKDGYRDSAVDPTTDSATDPTTDSATDPTTDSATDPTTGSA